MNLEDKEGTFKVIDSFTIRRKKEFYLFGELLEGKLKENYFVNIQLNESLFLSAKISSVEEVEISNDSKLYHLIIINCHDEELNDILFALNVGSENIYITLTGLE